MSRGRLIAGLLVAGAVVALALSFARLGTRPHAPVAAAPAGAGGPRPLNAPRPANTPQPAARGASGGSAGASRSGAASPAAMGVRPGPASPGAAGVRPGPAPALTGNLMVLVASESSGVAELEGTGATLAGKSVPEIGLVTVRPPAGVSPAAFARRLRSLPGVESVQPEHRYVPRSVPDDPALTVRDPSDGAPWQWYLSREGFYQAWNVSKGNGALVGVIDTGIDATHPDLRTKISALVDQQSPEDSTGPAGTDQVGHGTNVASLACADTDNGLGMASAGYDCRMVIEKSDFTDSSIDASIVDATNRHVQALNMSFGPSTPSSAPAPAAEVKALDYAAAHKVVLVAAAADTPTNEEGDPANALQPPGTGPDLDKGLGLDVTAAQYDGSRAPFAGYGSEVSMAAFGAYDGSEVDSFFSTPCSGPPAGIFGAYPANSTQMEQFPPAACRVDFQGDSRYATVAGTSMAAPQVAATAAMMRVLNPYATVQDVVRLLKQTASRPAHTGWTSDLGWGVLDAGAALDAVRRVDHLAPVSRLFAPKVTRHATFVLHWTGHDQQRPGLIASGIGHYYVYLSLGHGRSRLLARTSPSRHALTFHGQPGHRYVFYVVAVDRAGNRQRSPTRVTTTVI